MPDPNTSQLGLIQLGEAQLGNVEPSGGPGNSSFVTAAAATLASTGTVSSITFQPSKFLLLGVS